MQEPHPVYDLVADLNKPAIKKRIYKIAFDGTSYAFIAATLAYVFFGRGYILDISDVAGVAFIITCIVINLF